MQIDLTDALRPFSAVVLDMDGTLLDTESVFRASVFEAAAEFGVAMTDALHLSMVGSSGDLIKRLLIDAYGPAFPLGLYEERCRSLAMRRLEAAVPLKAGALEFIDMLIASDIPLAIATSSSRRSAESHLGRSGLLAKFGAIVARDDVVSPKPHPEPYLTAAARLGVDPVHCLAIEDSHTGVRAAHAAGMQTVMVPDLLPASDEIRALGIMVMDSLHHVRRAAFPPIAIAS
jgi:HAD superfamily hydrolase (TIGR01509 family)